MRLFSKTGRAFIGAFVAFGIAGFAVAQARAADPLVKPGDKLAIVGDSITEQRIYSVYIEDYILMCKPVANVRVMQFGWSGDTAGGFLRDKLHNDMLRYKPSVMTTCFGMNDGGYRAISPDTKKSYSTATQTILDDAKKGGVRTIILGAPGCVDSDSFRSGTEMAKVYNETLAAPAQVDEELAKKNDVTFADVHGVMMDAMGKLKAKYGNKYQFAGGDGVHPGANGHLAMAYAFLKAMGFDGQIGTITYDLAAGTATASDGHVVGGVKDGAIEVESSKYPFCLTGGKPEDSSNTVSAAEYVPFNQDLNRFMLIVKGASGKVKVTWGKESKEFDAEAAGKGINLASEFPDNPFSHEFAKVNLLVAAQQDLETKAIKGFIYNIPMMNGFASAENKPWIEKLADDFEKKDLEMFDAAAGAVKPLKHTIKVEAVK